MMGCHDRLRRVKTGMKAMVCTISEFYMEVKDEPGITG